MLYDAKELSYHKISKVETYKVRTHFPRLVGKNAFRDEHAYGDEVVVKRIFTDQGACGWGLASGLFYHQDLSVDQKILGKSVADVFDPAVGIASDDLSTFDFALHDLAGQIMNVPCYKMFGNAGINPVPVYDTLIYFDDISPDERPGGLMRIYRQPFLERKIV